MGRMLLGCALLLCNQSYSFKVGNQLFYSVGESCHGYSVPTFPSAFATTPRFNLKTSLSKRGDEGESNKIWRESRLSKQKAGQKLRHKRLRRLNHQESRKNAAGAEPLFSFSLWERSSSFCWTSFAKNSIAFVSEQLISRARRSSKAKTKMENLLRTYAPTTTINLPTIDCEWACHSDEEMILLQQMKLLLQKDLKPILDKQLHRRYPDVYSDFRLLRFLRKSLDRDPISASERYRSFLVWREENEVDEIREMVEKNYNISKEGYFHPCDDTLNAVADYFPCNFSYMLTCNNDLGEKDGGGTKPAVLYAGSWDTSGITDKILSSMQQASESNKEAGPIVNKISLQDFLNYWIYLYEAIHHHLYNQSRRCGEMIYLDEVCDLSGLSLRQFTPAFVGKVMKPWLRMTQSFYPETTRTIYVLNPPTIINLAWNLVTPLLSKGTIDKIRFVRRFQGSADEFCRSNAMEDSL